MSGLAAFKTVRVELTAELNQYLSTEKALLDPDIYDILIFNKEGTPTSSTHEILKGIMIDPEYFSKGRRVLLLDTLEI